MALCIDFRFLLFFLGLALFFLICWPHPWTIVLDAHRSLFSPSLGWFVSFNWKRKMNKSGGITKWINKQINENKNKHINQWNVYGHTRDNTTYKQLVLPRSFGTIVTLKLFSVSMVNTLARWHLKFTSISKLTGLIELSLHHTPTHPEPFHLPSSFGPHWVLTDFPTGDPTGNLLTIPSFCSHIVVPQVAQAHYESREQHYPT